MINFTPITRMSLGLVLLTISVLITANWLGLTPDKREAYLDARIKVAETVAVQVSKLAEHEQNQIINDILTSLFQRNDDITAISLKLTNGRVLADAGKTEGVWDSSLGETSTPTRVLVPIYSGKYEWGQIVIQFTPLDKINFLGFMVSPVILLLLFTGIFGFALYYFFLKRALSYLDPASVIPERVKTAMDIFSEGVMILDKNERIVMINSSFAEITETSQSKILGKKPSTLQWVFTNEKIKDHAYPWTDAINESDTQKAIGLSLKTNSGINRNFMVNSAPILDPDGNNQGVLTTFDDITKLERRNIQLSTMVEQLKTSQEEVQHKNEELEVLASQDSLTGCLNRRSFFEIMEESLKKSNSSKTTLSCIMLDIDFFKAVNDNYGHGVGDNVIRRVSEILIIFLREGDFVCRYGGEEFCLLLENTNTEQALLFAERIRRNIEKINFSDDPTSTDLKVTASLGISDSSFGGKTPSEIINQADYALYGAKESGRNKVVLWSSMLKSDSELAEEKTPEPVSVDENTESRDKNTRVADKVLENISDNKPTVNDAILTNLPGRADFLSMITGSIDNPLNKNHHSAILFIDIDNFKRINNALGYDVGDRILHDKCKRLSQLLRSSDKLSTLSSKIDSPTISRLSGDQFGVLINNIPELTTTSSIASRIISKLAEPYHIDEHIIYATCSVGISTFPNDGDNSETLLMNAEIAMNRVKAISGNGYHFYAHETADDTVEILDMEGELRAALTNNEMSIYYQPKVNILTEKIVGMEALLRWKHPTKGLILPSVFLPIAEKTGLIHELGIWVFREVCKQAKEWDSQGIEDFTIAVNISATQFMRSDFVGQIVSTLNNTRVNPKLLEIEITENTVLHDIDTVSSIISQMRSLGISSSLDDFGTGYSSLHYIKKFTIDSLKIDISFINNITTDPDDVAIVTAIIAMAHAMHVKVIAEGVENREQLSLLKELGCDEIQGYIYSRAKPKDEATLLLRSNVISRDPENIRQLSNDLTNQKRRKVILASK
jgi:diguanylate cyclase (GGDEF)-like protein/PAS domain S-box-containing protein